MYNTPFHPLLSYAAFGVAACAYDAIAATLKIDARSYRHLYVHRVFRSIGTLKTPQCELTSVSSDFVIYLSAFASGWRHHRGRPRQTTSGPTRPEAYQPSIWGLAAGGSRVLDLASSSLLRVGAPAFADLTESTEYLNVVEDLV